MTVYFIGAGPGAADLITLRGLNRLRACPVCLYAGSLVEETMLSYLPSHAERRNSYGMTLEEIIIFLRTAHEAGRDVARLHSGDVSFYSAMGEQIRALQRLNIPYEIIPGVPAFAAAAAAIGQELTVPRINQSLVLTRGARNATPMPASETPAALGAAKATMIIHLFAAQAKQTEAQLMPIYGADCPIIIAAYVSRPNERIIRGQLSQLADLVAREGIKRTALLFVGRALANNEAENKRSHLYETGLRK